MVGTLTPVIGATSPRSLTLENLRVGTNNSRKSGVVTNSPGIDPNAWTDDAGSAMTDDAGNAIIFS